MPGEDLFSRDHLGDEEWAVTPEPEDIVPAQIERKHTEEQFRAKLDDNPAAVILTHTDADGFSSAALLTEYSAGAAVQPLQYHGGFTLRDALDVLAEHVLVNRVYITDLGADDPSIADKIRPLTDTTKPADVIWCDHHQWSDETVQAVEDAGARVVIDEDECTASLLARELEANPPDQGVPFSLDDHLHELAEVTRDIDLWIRDDPRSERLNVLARILPVEKYIETVREHGLDWPDLIEDMIDDKLAENRELEESAVRRAATYRTGALQTAITYVRGGRSSQIGNDLVEVGESDIAIVCKPHGGVGVYSHSDGETFARCHEIAAEFGGGGHPTAAGFEIPAEAFRDYAEYWLTAGKSIRPLIVPTIREVVTDGRGRPVAEEPTDDEDGDETGESDA